MLRHEMVLNFLGKFFPLAGNYNNLFVCFRTFLCTFELRLVERGCFSLLSDSKETHSKDSASSNHVDNDEVEYRLDFHAFFLPRGQEWDEEWGGYLVYVDEEGEEIQRH